MQALKETDFSWHADQPDVPKMSAQQMKEFMDAPVRVLLGKVNELVEASLAQDTELNVLSQKDTALQEDIDELEKLQEAIDEDLTAAEQDIEVLTAVQTGQGAMLDRLQNQLKEVNKGLSGEYDISALPMGLSYAAEDVTLCYLADPEINEYASLTVSSGAYIVKTVGQILSGMDEISMIEGAVTVYVMSRGGKLSVIQPSHDMYGIRYVVHAELTPTVVTSFPTDPDYQPTGYEVPTVEAVKAYVLNKSEVWTFELEDGRTVNKRVVLV